MPDQTVYRSSAPEVLAVLATYHAETEAWQERAKTLLADLGFADRHLMTTNGFGGKQIIGVEFAGADESGLPAGWRIKARNGVPILVPDKRQKVGREAARRIDECQPPGDPRNRLPGMPGDFMTGGDDGACRLLAPAMRERNGVLYVIWSTDKVPEIPAEGPDREAFFTNTEDGQPRQFRTGIDLAIWERMKLSAWYALLEDEEATADA